ARVACVRELAGVVGLPRGPVEDPPAGGVLEDAEQPVESRLHRLRPCLLLRPSGERQLLNPMFTTGTIFTVLDLSLGLPRRLRRPDRHLPRAALRARVEGPRGRERPALRGPPAEDLIQPAPRPDRAHRGPIRGSSLRTFPSRRRGLGQSV